MQRARAACIALDQSANVFDTALGSRGKTHARDKRPTQAKIRVERPMDAQMKVAVAIPLEWFVIVSSWQDAPTMRATQRRTR